MHFMTYELKRKKRKPLLFWRILRAVTFHTHGLVSRVQPVNTLFQTYHFLSFCFSTLIPNWYVLKWRKTSQKTVIISHKERIRPLYPLLFRIHRNSRTPDVKGITMGRGPIWGFILWDLSPGKNALGTRLLYFLKYNNLSQLHMTDVMNWWLIKG